MHIDKESSEDSPPSTSKVKSSVPTKRRAPPKRRSQRQMDKAEREEVCLSNSIVKWCNIYYRTF